MSLKILNNHKYIISLLTSHEFFGMYHHLLALPSSLIIILSGSIFLHPSM